MPRVRPVGGRGKSVSLDLVRKLSSQGLSDARVREKLKARGLSKGRISQLMKAVAPARSAKSAVGVRKTKQKSKSFSLDLVRKLHSEGLSNERVRSKLKLRGYKKSRICQLMKVILIKRQRKSLTNGSVESENRGQTKQTKNTVSVQSAVKRLPKQASSVDIEKLIAAEMNKRAPAGSVERGHCIRNKNEPLRGDHSTKSLKRTSKPKQDFDVENLVRAQMQKTSKRPCIAGVGATAKVAKAVCIQAKASGFQENRPAMASDVASGVARIHALRRNQFACEVDWAFAILCQPARDLGSVQKAYREFMRRLHPDKAGADSAVAAAVELIREATNICEKTLSMQRLPSRPTQLKFSCGCTEAGKRSLKVSWIAPKASESAPVHRYIVAVLDPSFNEVLPIATLETDYCQELKRYLAFDDPELCSHVISEEHLRKMPRLFKSDWLTVHVAAANREGQSEWSTLKISLNKLKKLN